MNLPEVYEYIKIKLNELKTIKLKLIQTTEDINKSKKNLEDNIIKYKKMHRLANENIILI